MVPYRFPHLLVAYGMVFSFTSPVKAQSTADLLQSSQLEVSNYYITHIMCRSYLLSFADFDPIFLLQPLQYVLITQALVVEELPYAHMKFRVPQQLVVSFFKFPLGKDSF